MVIQHGFPELVWNLIKPDVVEYSTSERYFVGEYTSFEEDGMVLIKFTNRFCNLLVERPELGAVKLLRVVGEARVLIHVAVPGLVEKVIAKDIGIVHEFSSHNSPIVRELILNTVRVFPEVTPCRGYLRRSKERNKVTLCTLFDIRETISIEWYIVSREGVTLMEQLEYCAYQLEGRTFMV